MEDFETEQIIHNIVNELHLLNKVSARIDFNEDFCRFYLTLLMYDPTWNISIRQVMHIREEIQQLINFLLTQLKSKNDPAVVTLKMQHFFQQSFSLWPEIEANRLIDLRKSLRPLRISILEPEDSSDLTGIYEKLIVYFILSSGMGNPNHDKVYKVSEQVVKSVISFEELKNFLNTPYVIRLNDFDDLMRVCGGIRLYNWNCERSSIGISNLPKLLSEAIMGMKRCFTNINYEVHRQSDVIKKAINSCYHLKVKREQEEEAIVVEVELPQNVTLQNLEHAIRFLIAYKQFYLSIEKLCIEIEKIEEETHEIQKQFDDTLKELHGIIIPNFFVAANKIFPYFEILSISWNRFQDKVYLLGVLNRIAETEGIMVACLDFPHGLVNNFRRENTSKIKIEEPSYEELLKIQSIHCKITKIEEKKENDEELRDYEFKGHCCVMLVLTNGFLIEGNEDLGIVEYLNRRYVFSSTLAIKAFLLDPNYFSKSVLYLARKKCELIVYLNIKDDLEKVRNITNLIEEKYLDLTHQDLACQVDDHFLDSYIDHEYSSSVWEHRRRAAQLTTLSFSKTKAIQTEKHHSILTKKTQTWLQKTQSTQTVRDSYTNTNSPIYYIYGLRGRKDDKQAHLPFNLNLF